MVLPICKLLIEMAPVLLFRLEFSYQCQAPDPHRSHATQLFLQLLVDFVNLTGFDSFKIFWFIGMPNFLATSVPHGSHVLQQVVFSQNLFIRKFVFEIVSEAFFSGLNSFTCVKLLTHIEHMTLGSS